MITRSLTDLRSISYQMDRYTNPSRRSYHEDVDQDLRNLFFTLSSFDLSQRTIYENSFYSGNLGIINDDLIYKLWKSSKNLCTTHGDDYEILNVPLVTWTYVFQIELESRGL